MPKWQLSMMFYFQSGNFQKVRLGPLRRRRLQCGRVLRLGLARGPSTVDRTGWGRASLLGYTWEEVAWDIAQLGSCHLGKYPWKVATWEQIIWESFYIDFYSR